MAGASKSVSDTFAMTMRPNLSIERLAVTLAALGTTAVITACSSEPAAVRPEQTPAASASPPPPPPQAMPNEAKKTEGEREPTPTTVATATATATASATPRRHMAPGGGGDKGSTGQASCGAGTCTADPKKK